METATLHVHICAQRRGYNVTFSTEAQALDYLTARQSTHAWSEIGENGSVPTTWTALLDYLYPTCEHGMSANLCHGPDHFMSRDQEMAMGW